MVFAEDVREHQGTAAWKLPEQKIDLLKVFCLNESYQPLCKASEISLELSETVKAREMGLIPAEWDDDLSAEADFAGFDQLVTSLITSCDESALSVWRKNVDETAFPQRNMHRDDALVLLMLSAEALGYNCYNARQHVFYLSTGPLLQTAAPKKWQPELDGNTYVQNEGGILVSWLNEAGYVVPFGFYYNDHRDTVTDVIRNVLGDENGIAFRS